MKIFLTLFILSLAASSVLSLRCYFCQGTNGTSCAYPPNLSVIAQHPCNSGACSTLVYQSGNATTTVRGCNPNNFCRNPPVPPHNQVVDCRTCTRNLCNNSSILRGSVFSSMAVLSIALAFSKVFLS